MSESIPAEFFENIEEHITAANQVLAVFSSDRFICVLESEHVFCGLDIDVIEVEGRMFVEFECWMMRTEAEKLDVSAYPNNSVDLLIASIQPRLRWGKLVREDGAITLSRNDLISTLLDESDLERIVVIADELILETQLCTPVFIHLLGQEQVSDEVISALFDVPEHAC